MSPTVACVMLTANRPEMARRAIESFRAQAYDPTRRMLVILDTSISPILMSGSDSENEVREWQPGLRGRTIGDLRNKANAMAEVDIFVHWDDDDVSHPRRIEEQVALLQAGGKACVGYRQAIFWDTRAIAIDDPRCVSAWQAVEGGYSTTPRNEAWLYSEADPRYMLGASMCYWRSAWEACPFDDAPHEDRRWQLANNTKTLGVPGFGHEEARGYVGSARLICSIHSGNTSSAYSAEAMRAEEWQRAPEYDAICAERMRL